MEKKMKPVEIVGRVLGLVMGSKFTTPALKTLEKNPLLPFGL